MAPEAPPLPAGFGVPKPHSPGPIARENESTVARDAREVNVSV